MVHDRTVAFSAVALAGALVFAMGLPPFYNTIFGEEETRAYSLPMMGVGVAYILVGAGVLSRRMPGYALAVVAAISAVVISPGWAIMGLYPALAFFLFALPLFVWGRRSADHPPKPPVIDPR